MRWDMCGVLLEVWLWLLIEVEAEEILVLLDGYGAGLFALSLLLRCISRI